MGKIGNVESVEERLESKVVPPPMYKVILNNDDYTPMDFVVVVLQKYFRMNEEQATNIMLAIHEKGKAICGIFPHGIAETKVNQVNQFARENQHPLLCLLEKA